MFDSCLSVSINLLLKLARPLGNAEVLFNDSGNVELVRSVQKQWMREVCRYSTAKVLDRRHSILRSQRLGPLRITYFTSMS